MIQKLRETCLICKGRGRLPYPIRDKFTGRVIYATTPCGRCRGVGRVVSN